MSNAPIVSTLRSGVADVRDRQTGRDLGQVRRIEWPREVPDPSNNGRMVITETCWEARRPDQVATVNHFGFPTFDTRREAAAHLAR